MNGAKNNIMTNQKLVLYTGDNSIVRAHMNGVFGSEQVAFHFAPTAYVALGKSVVYPFDLVVLDSIVSVETGFPFSSTRPLSDSLPSGARDALKLLYHLVALQQNRGIVVPPTVIYSACPPESSNLFHAESQRLGAMGLVLKTDTHTLPDVLVSLLNGDQSPLFEYFQTKFGQKTVPPFGGDRIFGEQVLGYDDEVPDPYPRLPPG